MPDIRLVRRQGSQIWIWSGVLAAIGLSVWAAAFIFGDPTDPAEQPRVGAAAQFGAERAQVLPMEPVPFASLTPLSRGDLGRLVRFSGVAETSPVRGNVWVRASDGRRILMRLEPLPPEGVLANFRPGRSIQVDGYLQNISRAEFIAWADSLGISIPRPPPAPRFGQLPGPEFARIDALFIQDFYISVRPEALQREAQPAGTAPQS
jgi:hypothetical protein